MGETAIDRPMETEKWLSGKLKATMSQAASPRSPNRFNLALVLPLTLDP